MANSGEEFRRILHIADANLDRIGIGLFSLKETALTIIYSYFRNRQFVISNNCSIVSVDRTGFERE
jgi:hypothetical protein